jgi:hypothetical protein
MAKANTSSIKTKNGDKIAAFGTQQTAAIKASFGPNDTEKKDQVINARKAVNVDAKKAKAKARAKMAKASKKKNKK